MTFSEAHCAALRAAWTPARRAASAARCRANPPALGRRWGVKGTTTNRILDRLRKRRAAKRFAREVAA